MTYMSPLRCVRSENANACHTHTHTLAQSRAHYRIRGGETYGSHLTRTHVERLLLFSARRLDLDVVSWPAALPRCRLLRPKPIPRQLALGVEVCKVGVGTTLERREARDAVAKFAGPVVGTKVMQGADKKLVYLFGGRERGAKSRFSPFSEAE